MCDVYRNTLFCGHIPEGLPGILEAVTSNFVGGVLRARRDEVANLAWADNLQRTVRSVDRGHIVVHAWKTTDPGAIGTYRGDRSVRVADNRPIIEWVQVVIGVKTSDL